MKNLKLIFLMFVFSSFSLAMWGQTTLKGTVKDDSNQPLVGASVVIDGTTTGAFTDENGGFSISTDKALPIKLTISYIGFLTQTIDVTSDAAINVTLSEGVSIGEEVVVSASRKKEKVQDAPASISVINQKEISNSTQPNPVRMLISVPGVQIQQQSASRMNIEMRGAAGLFGTSVFPIMDYRSLVGPGIGTFDGNVGSNIDIANIEVVRGPGSALYGPGVTSGVVHFITKNPIDYTGTTVQIGAGEANVFNGAVRYAQANEAKTFGFKVNASYARGDEFTLDPNDPDDALQIAKFKTQIVSPKVVDNIATSDPDRVLLTQEQLDPDGDGNMMQDFYNSLNINTTLEFRPSDDLTAFVSGGVNTLSAVFYNSQGEGLNQTTEYWTQARVQKGGLFAQLFYIDNNGGSEEKPTFLYQTGNESAIGRKHLEGQVQYNFGLENFLDADFTTGIDYRSAISDTRNLVYGRNEQDDDYSLVGAYLQGKFKLMDKLDLVLAGRYDQFLFLDDGAFAPRAALVYKASPKHTFRASYNKASAPNSALQLNIDFPLATIIPGAFDIWLRGNKETQTFSDNPVIDWSIPGLPSVPVGTPGFPLAFAYGAVTPTILGGFQDAVTAGQIDQATYDLIAGILTDPTFAAGLGTTGSLNGYNFFDGSPLGLIDAPQSKIRTESTFEIGYKGLIGDKLGVSVDVYNITAKNFTLFTAISPTYALVDSDIPNDLGAGVQGIAQPQIEAALLAAGMDPAQAAGTAAALGAQINGAYNQGGTAFAAQIAPLMNLIAVTPTQEVPDNGITHMAAGYRTFDQINYTGADIGLNYYVNRDLSAFFNYSFISENDFMVNVVGAEGVAPLPYALGIPKNKFRTGILYTPEKGVNANVSFQHDPSFLANFGQYSGMTDVKNLVDLGVGYNFENGLNINVSATNLFNSEYRAFPNMPKIGRRVLGRVTYSF